MKVLSRNVAWALLTGRASLHSSCPHHAPHASSPSPYRSRETLCTRDSPLSAPWAPDDPRSTHTFPGPYKQGKGLRGSVGNRVLWSQANVHAPVFRLGPRSSSWSETLCWPFVWLCLECGSGMSSWWRLSVFPHCCRMGQMLRVGMREVNSFPEEEARHSLGKVGSPTPKGLPRQNTCASWSGREVFKVWTGRLEGQPWGSRSARGRPRRTKWLMICWKTGRVPPPGAQLAAKPGAEAPRVMQWGPPCTPERVRKASSHPAAASTQPAADHFVSSSSNKLATGFWGEQGQDPGHLRFEKL